MNTAEFAAIEFAGDVLFGPARTPDALRASSARTGPDPLRAASVRTGPDPLRSTSTRS